MNIWLGPRERQYVRAMQDFAYRLDKDVRIVPVTVSDAKAVRAYGLTSKSKAAVYLHHFADHRNTTTNLTVTLEVPQSAKAYWYSPESAAIVSHLDAIRGPQTFAVPAFTIDLALLITSGDAPDIDRDGVPNDLDSDDDNDGIPDLQDAFPLDPEEWADKDGDGDYDPLTAAAWSDSTKSGSGTINLNTAFWIPATAKAVVFTCSAKDDAVGSTIGFKAKSTTTNASFEVITEVANVWYGRQFVVPIAADGTVYYTFSATFTNLYLRVVGWYI